MNAQIQKDRSIALVRLGSKTKLGIVKTSMSAPTATVGVHKHALTRLVLGHANVRPDTMGTVKHAPFALRTLAGRITRRPMNAL